MGGLGPEHIVRVLSRAARGVSALAGLGEEATKDPMGKKGDQQ